MMNFIKSYDWLLLATVIAGGLIALAVFHKGKKALDKKAMEAAKVEAA